MTNGNSGKIVSWVTAIVAVLLLLGSGATAYSGLNSKVGINSSKLGGLDDVRDRLIRTETKQDNILKELQRLGRGIDRIEDKLNDN